MTDQHARVTRQAPARASTVLKGEAPECKASRRASRPPQAETALGLIHNRAHGAGRWQLAAT
jgi:hypothetical protein